MKIIVSWLALLIVLITNSLANILPINGMNTGEISALYPNYFVPAGFTFSIWGLIYLFQIAYTTAYTYFQLRKPANEWIITYFDRVHTLYLLTCLLNAGWILAWHYLLMPVALSCMLAYLTLLTLIFLRGFEAAKKMNLRQQLVLFTPMVIYLGWICVATIANITAALVWLEFNGGPMYSVVMIGIATLLSTYITFRFRVRSHALVLLWALWGIYNSQYEESSIRWAVVVGMGLLVVALVGSEWFTRRRGDSNGATS